MTQPAEPDGIATLYHLSRYMRTNGTKLGTRPDRGRSRARLAALNATGPDCNGGARSHLNARPSGGCLAPSGLCSR